MLLLAGKNATMRPRSYTFYYQKLAGVGEERLCVRKSLFVFWRTQLLNRRFSTFEAQTPPDNLQEFRRLFESLPLPKGFRLLLGSPSTSRSLADSIFMVKGLCTNTVSGFKMPSGASDGLA